jgi:hypothetical protein
MQRSLKDQGYINHSLIRQEKGVKHTKIYAIDLRTKIPYLPIEQNGQHCYSNGLLETITKKSRL